MIFRMTSHSADSNYPLVSAVVSSNLPSRSRSVLILRLDQCLVVDSIHLIDLCSAAFKRCS